MILPVTQHAGEQVGFSQKWTVFCLGGAKSDMVAPTGTGMLAIEHKLFSSQSTFPGLLIKGGNGFYQIIPAFGRMHIDLYDARVRCDHQFLQTWILGGFIALEHHGYFFPGRNFFNAAQQLQIRLESCQRGHKYIEFVIPDLDTKRGMNNFLLNFLAPLECTGGLFLFAAC